MPESTTAFPENIECPLCLGKGELSRTEVLERLGHEGLRPCSTAQRRGSHTPHHEEGEEMLSSPGGRNLIRNWSGGLQR